MIFFPGGAHPPETPGEQAAPPSGGNQSNKWTVLGIVGIGVFMATLDASIVNISLPKIASSFHVPLSGMVEWVIIGYLIVVAGILLSLGRLADMVGRKLLWTMGLILFTVSSALCGAAPSLPWLVFARAAQGVGGAMLMAISPAMTTRAFPSNERGRALGIIAAIVAIGTSAGPTLGGIITEAFTWRWIFYINVPVGIIGVFATLRYFPEKIRLSRGSQRFDPVGASLLCGGLTALMLGMTFGQEAGWSSGVIIGLFCASVVLLVLFVFTEKRVSQPIVDLSLFRIRLFAASLVSSFLSFMALFAVMFLMPFYLEELRGFTPDHAGLLLTAVPLTIGLVSPVSGYLSDIFGSRALSSLGLGIASAGLWFLADLKPHTSVHGIIWPLVIAGLGQALFQTPNNNAMMGSVPPNRVGTASGFLATVRVLGQGFSVALAGAIFTSLGGAKAGVMLSQKGAAGLAPLQNTFIHAYHMALMTCMIIATIGVLTSLMRGRAR